MSIPITLVNINTRKLLCIFLHELPLPCRPQEQKYSQHILALSRLRAEHISVRPNRQTEKVNIVPMRLRTRSSQDAGEEQGSINQPEACTLPVTDLESLYHLFELARTAYLQPRSWREGTSPQPALAEAES